MSLYDVPQEQHLHALKHILRYIRGTIDHRLRIHKSPTTDLVAYSDVDWGDAHLHIAPLPDTMYLLVTTLSRGPPNAKELFLGLVQRSNIEK